MQKVVPYEMHRPFGGLSAAWAGLTRILVETRFQARNAPVSLGIFMLYQRSMHRFGG